MARSNRGAVSDTSSEGERTTIRFLPLEGKIKSPKKNDSHSGKNGAKLRVCAYLNSKVVTKVNPSNWTDEAHAKFAELYCEGRMDVYPGKDYGKSAMRKKKDTADKQLAEMLAEMTKLKAELEVAQAEAKRKAEVEKKRKAEELKKQLAALEAEAEKKRKAEELKKQLAALEADDSYSDSDSYSVFDDSDDEDAQEFNPFKHNGVTYHRDDEDKLYTEDGDYWGYINERGEVFEGDEDDIPCGSETKASEPTPTISDSGSKHQKSYTEEEDKKIEEYMMDPVNQGRKNTHIYRELAKLLSRRKFQNIQTRWERYVHPKMLKRQLSEERAENAELKRQLETLKASLLNIVNAM